MNTDHVSFYKSDYLAARQLTGIQLRKHESELRDGSETEAGGELDLCQLLRRVSSLHALRAPDPSLMLRYEEVTCPADVENERCQIRKQRSFARRKTLALKLILMLHIKAKAKVKGKVKWVRTMLALLQIWSSTPGVPGTSWK